MESNQLQAALDAAMAKQAALEAEISRLAATEQLQRKQLETLREVSRILNSSLDQKHVLELILDQLARVVKYDSASIMMLAGERMQITGTITGWFLVGSGGGRMLLPWFIGQIFAFTSPKAMTTVLLVDIAAIFLVLFAFISQRKVPLPEPVQIN